MIITYSSPHITREKRTVQIDMVDSLTLRNSSCCVWNTNTKQTFSWLLYVGFTCVKVYQFQPLHYIKLLSLYTHFNCVLWCCRSQAAPGWKESSKWEKPPKKGRLYFHSFFSPDLYTKHIEKFWKHIDSFGALLTEIEIAVIYRGCRTGSIFMGMDTIWNKSRKWIATWQVFSSQLVLS